ncbi:GFA family protein [Pseudovibrio brasiliensis]|nr:GFA family protein [Pseudovibrio brasiliensis]
MKRSGRCMCGAVSYKIDGDPVVTAQCHCEECRRTSGTGHSIGAMFRVDQVKISGDLGEYVYTSANGSQVTKAFCPNCGSPIYGCNTNAPDHMTLPLGSMDNAEDLEVQVVIFNRDKQHWDTLPETTAIFETQPDWKPEKV